MREDAEVNAWLASILPEDRLVVCTITRGEILFGLGKLAQGKRRDELEAKAEKLFAVFPCEPVPAVAADLYAGWKLRQQSRGLSLDENDLWIAATALAIGATLVSRDTDFTNIENLPLFVP